MDWSQCAGPVAQSNSYGLAVMIIVKDKPVYIAAVLYCCLLSATILNVNRWCYFGFIMHVKIQKLCLHSLLCRQLSPVGNKLLDQVFKYYISIVSKLGRNAYNLPKASSLSQKWCFTKVLECAIFY